MTNKSVKVGLEIVDETQPFRKLAKAVDELEHAGSEVDGLKDSILNLAEAHSKVEQQQGLVDSFKRLKKESIEAAQAIEKQEREIKQLAAAMGNSPTKKMVADFEKAKKTAKQLKARQEQLGVALQKTRTGLKQNGISTKKLAQAQQRLTVKSKLLANGTNRIAAKMAEARQEIDKTARASKNMGGGLDKSTSSLGGVALKAGVAGAAISGLVLVAKEIVTTFTNVDREFDRMEKTFAEITGSSESANVEMNRMIDVANRLGLSFSEVSQGYSSFLASAKSANITFSESSDIFERTAAKVLALGGNTESVNGVLLAMSQMMSKGKVSTEELQQIAERLPGTFDLAAKSMGKTTAEFREMVEKGDLLAKDFLPRFSEEMRLNSEAAETNVQASARLKNEWQLLIKSLDESIGVSDGAQESMNGLAKAIKLLRLEAEENTDLIPDDLGDKVVKSIPIVNALYAVFGKVNDEVGKFIDFNVAVGEANAKAKQSTDELVQSLIRLNEARNGGDAAAIAKAEAEYAAALEKTGKAFSDNLVSEESRGKKLGEIKDKIKELTPKYDELSASVAQLERIGRQNTIQYISEKKEADKLKAELDALKTAKEELSKVQVGGGENDALKQQAEASQKLRDELDLLVAKLADLESLYSKTSATGKDSINTQVELYGAILDTKKAIEQKSQALAELNPELALLGNTAEKTFATLDEAPAKTREAFEAVGLSFSELSTGITDAEQKVINGVGNIVTHIKSVAGESKQAGEMLERYFVSASSKIKTPEGLEAFHKKFTEIADAAGFSAEKIKEMTDTVSPAFAKLGVDVDAVMNGISDSAETSMSNFSAAMEAAQQSGTNSMKLTQAAIDAVLKTLSSPEEFKAFDEQLKNLGIRSKATAEQLSAINEGRTKSTNEATEAVKKQNTVAKESVDVSKESAEATSQQVEAMKAAAEEAQGASEALNQWIDSQKDSIRSIKEMGLSVEEVNGLLNSFDESLSFNNIMHPSDVKGFMIMVQGLTKSIKRQGEELAQTKQKAVEWTESLSSATASTQDLFDAQVALDAAMGHVVDIAGSGRDAIVRIDETTLDNLQNAIDETKNRLKEMGETARQEAEDLQAQLAKLRGDDDLSRQLEEKRKLAALEEKLAAARKRNNQEEIEAYQEAINYQKQIFAEKEKQYNEEKRQQAEREKSRNERKERREEPTRSSEGSGGAQFDADKLGKEFKQSFEGAFDLNKLSKEFRKAFENEINQMDFSGFIKDLAQSIAVLIIRQLESEASRMAR